MSAYRDGFKLVLLLLITVPLMSQAKPKYRYTVTQIAGAGSTAYGINNAGQIAGRLTPGSGYHAFRHADGVLTDIGTLPGDRDSSASGINGAGVVVGSSDPDSTHVRAFLYAGGVMSDIGGLGADRTSASEINDAGQIVGSSKIGMHSFAFLYQNGVMQNLGAFPGTDRSNGNAINSSGHIAGSSGVGPAQGPNGSVYHAFLYKNGQMKDLGTLGGFFSYGNDINDLDQVVGYSTIYETSRDIYRAYVYSRGKMRNLGTLENGASSMAVAINNLGHIVGYSSVGGRHHAFIHTGHGKMRDLNAMIDPAAGWVINYAHGINDRGQIAGHGCNGTLCVAVRLDPIRHRMHTDAAGDEVDGWSDEGGDDVEAEAPAAAEQPNPGAMSLATLIGIGSPVLLSKQQMIDALIAAQAPQD